MIVAGYETLRGRGVEGEGPTDKVLEECALLLAADVVGDSGDDGVKIARIGVVRSLVGAAQLLCVDTGVLQVFMVTGVSVGCGLGSASFPGQVFLKQCSKPLHFTSGGIQLHHIIGIDLHITCCMPSRFRNLYIT